MLQSGGQGSCWTSPVYTSRLTGLVFRALGAVNGNHIKASSICRSGLRFLSNCHSNGVVAGRVWLLPLTHLLAELSVKVFLKCAWSWIKCDRYMLRVLRDHLNCSRPKEMTGLLLGKTGKGIRTWTSTNVKASLEAKQAKTNLLHKLGSHDVSIYLSRKVRHCLSDTFYTEALKIHLWNTGSIFDPISNPGDPWVVSLELSKASTWRNAQEVG